MRRAGWALTLAAGLLGALRVPASAVTCGTSTTYAVPGTYSTITNALAAIPAGTLTQDYCIQVGAGTYNENVFIGNHNGASAFRIVISTAINAGGAVIVGGSGSASPIFNIMNDSVTLLGLNIHPVTSGATWGVFASTASTLLISSCSVDESGGVSYAGGGGPAEIATFTTVDHSTFSTTLSNPGLIVNGSNNTIQYSYITSKDSTNQGTLAIASGKNNNFVFQSFMNNAGTGSGLHQNAAVVGSNGNVFSSSTFQTSGSDVNSSAIYMFGSNNVISTVTVISTTAGGGYGVYWTGAGSGNFIYGSTVSTVGSEPLYIASNGQSVYGSLFQNFGGSGIGAGAVQINNGSNNTIQTSTMTALNPTTAGGVYLQGASNSGNQFTQDFFSGSATSIRLDGGVTLTSIQNSTITNTAFVNGATTTTFTNDNIIGFNALSVANGSSFVTVYNSRITGTSGNGDTVLCANATHCSIVNSTVVNALGGTGAAIHLQPGSYSNIEFSTVTQSGGGTGSGVNFDGSLGSTVTASIVSGSGNAAGTFQNGAVWNFIDRSTFTSPSQAGVFFLNTIAHSSNNTIYQSFLGGGTGMGLEIVNDGNNQVINSTITGNTNNPLIWITLTSTQNVITGSTVKNAFLGNAALQIDAGSSLNTVSFSTITGSQGNTCNVGALMLGSANGGANNNTLSGDYINGANGNGLVVYQASNNTIQFSTMAAVGGGTCGVGDAALSTAAANSNTFSNDFFYGINNNNTALRFDAGSSGNSVTLSTMIASGAGGDALIIYSNAGNTNNQTISQSYLSAANPVQETAAIECGGSGNTVTSSVLVNYGSTHVAAISDGNTTLSNDNLSVSGSGVGVFLVGGCNGSFANNSTVSNSTITTSGGHGVEILGVSGVSIVGDVVSASTDVLVSGSTNTTVMGDVLMAGVGAAGDGVVFGGGGNTVIIGSTTVNGAPASSIANPNFAILDAGISPMTIEGYLVLRGTFQVIGSVSINEWNYNHVFGGGVYLGGATGWTATGDQIILDGANDSPPAPSQVLSLPSGANLGTLGINVPRATLSSPGPFGATTFNDFVAGSTVTFSAGTNFTFTNFNIYGALGGIIDLNSTVPGTPWNLAVTNSSVTLTEVADSNASGGNIVKANDGRDFDLGNNTNWGFGPQLVVQLPGQGWTEGSGYASGASAQTAGAGFPVIVRAVSYSSTTVTNAAMNVTLTGSDPFQNPGNGAPSLTQTLSGGVATFASVSASSAEPAGLLVTFNASGAPATASYADSAALNPGAFNHLQVLIYPSEQPGAGATANGGKINTPDVQITSRPVASVLVRAVDAFNNLETGVTDNVAIIGTNSSTATWESAAQPLSLGTTVFLSTVTFYSTGTFNLTVKDMANGFLANSSSMVVTLISYSSPTVALNVNQSTVTTLGGGLSGFAFDSQAVSKVLVSLESGAGLLYYTFPRTGIGSFSSGTPVFATATLQGQGAYVNWIVPLSDNALANRTTYYAQLRAVDGSNNVTVAFATFTFLPGLLGVGQAGEGTASLIPAVSSGCEPSLLTLTYTVGPSGLQSGGQVKVTFPPGWTGPTAISGSNPPPPGQAFINSSNAAALAGGSSQCSAGALQNAGASLCSVSANSPAFNSGDTISFVMSALPPIGPTGRGPQLFNVQSAVDGTGQPAGIAVQPNMTLNRGTTSFFVFGDANPMTLGPLQTSATMFLEMVDLCGNPVSTNVVTTATITLQAQNQFGVGVDTNAVIYATSSLGGVIVSSVTFWPGHTFSNGFYFETSTSGVSFETIHATGTALGMLGPNYTEANRSVTLFTSSLTFTSISIDSGTTTPGEKVSTITYVGAIAPAFIHFTPSVGGANWNVIISSDPVAFFPAVLQAGGQTTANQPINVSWTGVNVLANPPQFVPASTYYVLLKGAWGSVQDTSLSIAIPQSPSISGNLGLRGAGALVSIAGPGAGFGNQGVATSTGYFQVFGLLDQQYYAVQASTAILVAGQSVTLTTGAVGVQALAAGDLIPGTLAFPTTAFIRVSVTLPQPAPLDFSGAVKLFNSSGAPAGLGNLHFYQGVASSDNGAQAFGQAASTWTTLLVTPDTYTVVATMPDIRVSTQISNVAVGQFSTVNLPFVFTKKANVYGFVTIPSTTSFGAPVSISGQLVGVSSPSAFASAFVQPWSNGTMYSSAPYSLFGLDPGTWTITARNSLFLSTSTTIVISSNADVGDATFMTSGLLLPLSAGGVIMGTVTINGDTTQQTQCITVQNGFCPSGTFEVAVQAYNQRTFETAIVPIRLVKSATQTSSTFTIAGLASGSYVVQTALGGWSLSPAGGQLVTVSTPAVSSSSLTLNAGNVSTTLNITLPPNPSGGCHPANDAHNVGIWGPIYFGNGGRDLGYPDVVTSEVANSTVAIYCSSMTVTIPPQNNGFETIRVSYNPTGALAQRVMSPVQGAATTLSFDLSQPTVSVSGKVTFSGATELAFSTYSVSVSSIGGILTFAPTNYFCVINATSTIPVSTMHLELIPIDPLGNGSVPAIRDYGFPFASGGSSCNPETAFGGVWGLAGYFAQIQSDGSFNFPGVSPGIYRLRNYANLDLNPARGAEIGFFEQNIAVTTTTTNLIIPLSGGFNVTGLLVLPPGMTTSRTFQLSLVDNHGNAVAQIPITFNGNNAAPYALTNVANGVYSVSVLDYGQPYTFVAAPQTIRVAGANVANQNVALQPAGTIRANIAIQQTLSDGSKQLIGVTHNNSNLLPAGLSVDAIATPWVQGGFFHATSVNCSSPLICFSANPGPLTIDPNTDEMQIIGVLPGTYNVEFVVPPGVSAGQTGGLSLVSTVRSGVTVGPGQTVDLGVVGLTGGVALTGHVADVATSTPLAGIRMMARPSITQSGQVTARAGFQLAFTDQNGQYTFSSLDPTVRYYDVFAANRTSGRQGDVVAPYEQQIDKLVDVQSTTTLNFALNFASYSVSGRVVGLPGDQLVTGVGQSQGASPGATIMIQKVGVAPTANPIADVVFQTDAQGNFTVPALTAGQYVLYALALNYGTYQAGVTITTSSLNVGTIQLSQGATLSGSVRKVDGTAPSEDDIQTVVGAATDFSDYFFGLLNRDPQTRGITGYTLSGFKPGKAYRVVFVSVDHELAIPPEVSNVVFGSSFESRGIDVTFTPKKPYVTTKASAGPFGSIMLRLHSSQPFRERLLGDDNYSNMLSTLSALGSISTVTLSVDRRELTAFYAPGVNESSFTLRLSAFSAEKDPASLDPVNPEFVIFSTPTFFIGTDGASALNINNVEGGGLVMEGDQGHVTLPKGAFSVDVSSGLSVVFQRSSDNLAAAKLSAAGVPTVQANINALRYKPAAYPSSLFQAMASLPPSLSPFSAFYDILLPLGVRTALAQPVQLTVAYSTSTGVDPTQLNIYWFNAAANAYVLQQDVTGAAPVIDRVNHTITINVNHFSTFVLFNTGVNVITGASFGGTDIIAYNFPNPFDLSDKTVTSIHPGSGGAQNTVRGTMISIGLPPAISGEGKIKIFDVAGEKVRTMDLGSLAGGAYYYQPWDGRNDSGRDVASGVYIGQVLVGGKSKFFKMALIK